MAGMKIYTFLTFLSLVKNGFFLSYKEALDLLQTETSLKEQRTGAAPAGGYCKTKTDCKSTTLDCEKTTIKAEYGYVRNVI